MIVRAGSVCKVGKDENMESAFAFFAFACRVSKGGIPICFSIGIDVTIGSDTSIFINT